MAAVAVIHPPRRNRLRRLAVERAMTEVARHRRVLPARKVRRASATAAGASSA
jgi:hypothetical protein